MGLAISVVICAHNPRPDYLIRVLAALRDQTLSCEHWELLLVDNASQEPLSRTFDLKWHPHGRHVREDQLGLTAARRRGIKESSGEVVVFVDDDNLLDPDYLEIASKISSKWPMLGAWGGDIRGEFEVPPPEWTKSFWEYLAIRRCDRDVWSNSVAPRSESRPAGAGFCLRRIVLEKWVELLAQESWRIQLGRTGKSLMSGEDGDLTLTACEIGLGTGRFTELQMTHLIPASRLNEDYLVQLVHDVTLSGKLLLAMHGHREASRSRSERLWSEYRRLRLDRRGRRFHDAIMNGSQTALRMAEELEASRLAAGS
jgi:hypothetical protein